MSVDIRAIAKENIDNRVARVFVSSTFRDMRAERKYLMEIIFPDIKRHCKRLGIEFVPIDLRWGISDEQAERGETLERIFSSIDDSRPFFVCLLGDSYGSRLPSIDDIRFSKDFLEQHSRVKDYISEKRSYTDSEIRHGALDLNKPSRRIVNFHCWLRDENVRILIGFDKSVNKPIKPKPDDPDKLRELKREIDKKWKSECDIYTSVGDQKNKTDLYNLVDKEILKWIIRRFLKGKLPNDENDLTWEYAYSLRKMPTWLENQDFEQGFFERSRKRLYVLSTKRNRILNDFITPPESASVKSGSDGGVHNEIKETQRSNVLAITGRSGVGKSSLLVNWAQKYTEDYRKGRPDDLILTHYVSASEGSDTPANILRRFTEKLELELKKTSSPIQQFVNILLYFKEKLNRILLHNQSKDYTLDESKSLEEQKEAFCFAVSQWLLGSKKRRLILIIDGLNQLSEEDDGNKNLIWLPLLPDGVKLILSTTEDDKKTCEAIRRRGWSLQDIKLLDYSQKKDIVEMILKDRGRTLEDPQKERIRDAKVTENSLVLRVLLDELCYVGNYQNLDGEIDFYLAKEEGKEISEVGFLKRVVTRIEDRLAWLNGQRNVVAELSCLLSASRYGLTEDELEKASRFNQFEVSMFLGAFDSHLTNHSGRYSFSHKFIEHAVNDKYGSGLINGARKSLIEYFLKTFDLFKKNPGDEDFREYLVRSSVEVPYQLRELGDWNRLYEFLLDFDVFDELFDGTTSCDYCLYWNELLRLKNFPFNLSACLSLDDSRYDSERKADLWKKLGDFAKASGYTYVSGKAYQKALMSKRGVEYSLANEESFRARVFRENIENRVFRVFVSSNFREMFMERQYLAEVVFPRIGRYCKKRGVEFVPIDPRWGITEDQAQNGKTLEIWLKEIDHSRPFFICLLGDRYGSPISSLKGELNENFLKDYPNVNGYKTEDIGVTEAEIRHGVLDLEEEVDAHFWFRSPSSSCTCDPRLTALKERIRRDPRKYPIDEYVKPEDSQDDKTEWLEELGKQIEAALTAWIDKTWPNGNELSWFERQNLKQKAFERSRRRVYVPNLDDFGTLNKFVEGNNSNILAVIGKEGQGKSALLINWANQYQENHFDARVLTHYVAASEDSDSPKSILRRFTEELIPFSSTSRLFDGPDSQDKSLEDIKKEFVLAVTKRLEERPYSIIVLVVDGLNYLSELDESKYLGWLPELPERAKLIVSTVDSDKKTCEAIRRRGWNLREIEFLDFPWKSEIVRKILKERGRVLTVDQMQRICNAKVTENWLILRVLLDELCYGGNYQSLDCEIDFYLAKEEGEEVSEIGFLKRFLERLENRLAWLNEQHNVVTLLACLLSASRYGLTEEELLMISGCRQLAVSCFLTALDAHLIARSGRYSYSHNYIRRAIEQRYSAKLATSRELLIYSFQNGDDFSRRCQEVPWQLKELGQWDRLYDFLLNFDVLDELYDETLTCDFCQYWTVLLRSENGGFNFEGYLELDDSSYDAEKKGRIWQKLGVLTETYNFLDVSEISCSKAVESYRLLAAGGHNDYKLSLSQTLNRMAALHVKRGKHSQAESEYKESLSICRELAKKVPDIYNSHLANVLFGLAELHRTVGNYSQAEVEYEEGLGLYRDLEASVPGVYKSQVANLLRGLADLHRDVGKPSIAESEYKESLSIYRHLAVYISREYDSDVAKTLYKLASLHTETGSYSFAESEYEESLSIYQTLMRDASSVYDDDIGVVLNGMAYLHRKMGSYSESESEYAKSLSLRRTSAKRIPETYNPGVARTLKNLGALHREMGSYSESESEYAESLTLYRNLASKNPEVYNPDVAMTLNNLGNLHSDMGSYSESESEYEESLTLYRNLASKNPEVYNPKVATTLNNLVDLHRTMGSYSESESELAECLTLYRVLAENSPEVYNPKVATTLNNLGDLHRTMGSYSESESELAESLTISRALAENSPKVYNPDVATTLNNLGNLHRDMGSYSESESEYEESLALYRFLAKNSPDVYNPGVAMTLNNLGNLHREMCSYFVAESEYAESLTLYRTLASKNPEVYNPDVAMTLNNLAILHSEMGSYPKSECELKESLMLYRNLAKNSPEVYNPYVAMTLNNLAILQRNVGSYSQMESLYEESLKIRLNLAKENPEVYNPGVASTLNNLGNLHRNMGSYSVSESEYAESLTLYRALASKNPDVYNPGVAMTLNSLGNLHKTMGSYSESESEYEESLAIYRELAIKSPDIYNPYVASTLNNLGLFHRDMSSYSKSESELEESLTIYRGLAEKAPEVYNPHVAGTLFNLAVLYLRTERYDLAKEKLLEYVELYKKLPEAVQRSQAKQFEIAQKLLAEIREIEENQ